MIAAFVPEPSPWLSDFPGAHVWGPLVNRWLPRQALRAGLKLWSNGQTARRIEARFALRRALAQLAARQIPTSATTVVAPSLCARPLFAEAKRRGLKTVLVQDLPCLRRLHADLDRAAAAHPGSRFLNNHRASAQAIAEQEAEWVLADEVRVRSAYAASIISAYGSNVVPATHAPERPVALRRPRTLALAGIATPRHGIFELLDAHAQLPGLELLVRTGEGLEPKDLLQRKRVRLARPGERPDAVVAPAWTEAWLPEVHHAAANGIAVIATPQASGWLGPAVHPITAGDVAGLMRALVVSSPA